jgi:hypothetical protein
LFFGKDLGQNLYLPGHGEEMLSLGLPVVDLPPEILGLNRHFFETVIKIQKHPSLDTILSLASNKEPNNALQYFLTHFHIYKDSYNFATSYKFVPTLYVKRNEKC